MVYSHTMETLQTWVKRLDDRAIRIAAAFLAVAGAVMLWYGTGKQVVVVHGDEERSIRTHAMTVQEAVDDAGWTYSDADFTSPAAGTAVRSGMLIEYEPAHAIQLSADGDVMTAFSAERIPANLLASAGIPLFPGDRVWVDGLPVEDAGEPVAGEMRSLHVERAHEFELDIDGVVRTIRSGARTLGEALWDEGIVLQEADLLLPPAVTVLDEVSSASLRRSRALQITVDGRMVTGYSVADSVGEVLADAGVALLGLDYARPALDEPVPEDGRIQVVRVHEDVQVELEPLAFDISYQAVDTLEIDQLQILEEGTYGVEAVRVRTRIEDGEEVERSSEERWVAVEPVTRIVGYGTQIVIRTISTPYGTLEYWRAIPVYATSYSPCNLGVDWCGYTTASGVPAQKGVVGVIRSWFNVMRGQPVYVPDYGLGSIEDIGAGFSDRHWIDLGFSDEDFEAWHQWTTVYFLTPVPAPENILWILP